MPKAAVLLVLVAVVHVIIAVTADAQTTSIGSALQQHDYNRVCGLLSQTDGGDPKTAVSWVAAFKAQWEKGVAQRRSEYDLAVAQAKYLAEHDDVAGALSASARACNCALVPSGFRQEKWVVELIGRSLPSLKDYEETRNWQSVLKMCNNLRAIDPANTTWTDRARNASRQVATSLLYLRGYSRTLMKVQQERQSQTTRLLVEARLSNAASADSPPPGLGPPAPETIDWRAQLRDIDSAMLPAVIRAMVENWYRNVTYQQLVKGGLQNLRNVVTCPDIGATFPSCADATKVGRLVQALDQEIADIGKQEMRYDGLLRTIANLRKANDESVGLPDEVVVHEMVNGALDLLDMESTMIWPSQVQEIQQKSDRDLAGVGLKLEGDTSGYPRIVECMEGFPAYQAGVRSGAKIMKIDEEVVHEIPLADVAKKLRGPSGSSVVVVVQDRDRQEQVYRLSRFQPKLETVRGWQRPSASEWEWMADREQGIGYIRLTAFAASTRGEFDAAMEKIEAQRARGLVLDLRYNSGGVLNSAAAVAERFLDAGSIFSTHSDRSSQSVQTSVKQVGKDGKKTRIPVVVLVNGGSAAAAELAAGALQEHHRAVIVGEMTAGCGGVLTVFPTPSRNAALRLASAQCYLPSGRPIQREAGATSWGIIPDYAVPMSVVQQQAMLDARQDVELALRKGALPTAQLMDVDIQCSAAILLARLQIAGVKM